MSERGAFVLGLPKGSKSEPQIQLLQPLFLGLLVLDVLHKRRTLAGS
jgi:hypothetical protein